MNEETNEDMRLRLDIRDDEYLIRRYEAKRTGEVERAVIIELLDDRGLSLDREQNAKLRVDQGARRRAEDEAEELRKRKFRWIGGAIGFAIGFTVTRHFHLSGKEGFTIGGLAGSAGGFFFGDLLYWIVGRKSKR